jgi:recombination protein RecA
MGAIVRQLSALRSESLVGRAVEPVLPAPGSLADLAGRLIEVTGAEAMGRTSWLARLVAQAQREGETAAWLQMAPGMLYPPDLQGVGIDVNALVVGLLPDGPALLRTADMLLRSGGFGLVVVDLDGVPLRPTDGQLGRLLGLCQKHGAALALLTRETRAAETQGQDGGGLQLGSLVSLRLQVGRESQTGRELLAGQCTLRTEAVKDKRRGPGRRSEAEWRLPEGML